MKLFISLLIAFAMVGTSPVVNGDQCNGGDKTMPGGWSSISVDDSRVVLAAKHAVSAYAAEANEKITLLTIQDARQQVVAGMNYRMTLRVERDRKEQSASAVVWVKLDGTYKLIEWKWK